MKLLLLISILLTGCITVQDIVPSFDSPNKVNESNFMKMPCLIDGATVKKKPKVDNIP